MCRVPIRGFFFAAAFLLPSLCIPAQDRPIDQVLKQLEQVHTLSGVSMSPDGRWVAWLSRGTGNKDSVYLLDWKKTGTKPKRITPGDALEEGDSSNIAWSPDSTQFAFLSHGDKPQDQIYLL